MRKLWKHQAKEIEAARHMPQRLLLWCPGTGKSFTIVSIIKEKYEAHGNMRTLILCPSAVLYNWKNEFRLGSDIPQESVHVIDGTAAKRLKTCDKIRYTKDIAIVNYEALGTKAVMDFFVEWKPEIVVLDEIHAIKSYKAARAKNATKLCKTAKYKYGLSGTIILNSEMDLFQPFLALDGGKRFGTNFFKFRLKYFYDKKANAPSAVRFGGDWHLKESMEPVMQKSIYEIASRVKKDECLDLPPLVEKTHYVKLGKKQQRMYDDMKKQYIAFLDEHAEIGDDAAVADTALEKMLRLQQIVSGYIKTDKGDIIDLEENPRLDAVEHYLTELTGEHKVILWCSYRHDYKTLSKLCEKLKIKHEFITGAQSAKQKHEAMESFRNDSDVRVIIANRRAGGTGINLIEASYSIIYSRNFSLEEELQSQARNYRGGSEIHDRITKIDIVAENTVDEHVIKSLRNKEEIGEKILGREDLGDE